MVYVFFADGFEEVEALTPVDFLKRAGLDVCMVGVTGASVTGSHGIEIRCDATIDQIDDLDAQAYVLPGGMPGTRNLEKCEHLTTLLTKVNERGGLICAICAAPLVPGRLGLLNGKRALCYPGFEEDLHGAVLADGFVCADGNVITAKGAGAAMEFAFTIIETLAGAQTAARVRSEIQFAY